MGRALLVCVGSYFASVALSFGYLVVGAALTGKSMAAGERGALAVLAAMALTFLASTMLVFFGIGRTASVAARIGAALAYGIVGFVTLVGMGFVTLVVFNR